EPRPVAAPGVRFSVVIPTLDEAATVADTIAAARAALPGAEVVVADAGSGDERRRGGGGRRGARLPARRHTPAHRRRRGDRRGAPAGRRGRLPDRVRPAPAARRAGCERTLAAVQDRLRRPGALRLAGGVRAGRRLPAAPDHGGPRPGHPPAPRRRPRDRPAGGDDVGPPPPQRRPRPRARAQLADPAALHPARAAGAARPDVPAGALDDRSVSPVMSWADATIRSRSATDPPPDHPRSVPPGARDLPINHLALPGPAARETQMVGD